MPTLKLLVVPVVLVPVAAALAKVTAAVAAVQAALQTAVILSEVILTTYELTYYLVLEIAETIKISAQLYWKKILKNMSIIPSQENFICFFHVLQSL